MSKRDAEKFIPIKFWIVWVDGDQTKRLVKGYAFETPGWPEFHAVAWFGSRYFKDSNSGEWLIAHFESGKNVDCGYISEKEYSPGLLKSILDAKGRRKVRKAIREYL